MARGRRAPLEDRRTDLEAVLATVVHAAERVRRATRLDVALEHEHLVPILGGKRPASQAAHATADDDNVILALVATLAVAGTDIRRFLVRRLERHVIAEGHDLLTRGILRLRHVFARRLGISVDLRPHHHDGGTRSSMGRDGRTRRRQAVAKDRARRSRQHGPHTSQSLRAAYSFV